MEAAKTAVQLSLRRYQALQQQQHDVGSMPVTAAAPPSNTVAGAAAEYYHPAEHHHRPDTPQPSNAHGPHAGAAPDQPPPTLQAPGGAYQPAAATADAAELHAKAVRTQAATVVADLKLLRREVAEIGRRARKRRGRRWLVGGFV